MEGFVLSRSGLNATNEDAHIRACLRSLLLTKKGERPLYPNLGSQMREYLFRTLDASLVREMTSHLKKVIQQGEPRVKVSQVKVLPDAAHRSHLQVLLQYEILSNGKKTEIKLEIDS